MTEEMPPGRGFGAGPRDAMSAIIRQWYDLRDDTGAAQAAAWQTMQRRVPPPPYYRVLLSLASALIAEERYGLRYELAVILAQMACEVVVEQTLTPLLPKNKKPPKNFNLAGGKGAALATYTQLTPDRSITTEPFWTPFVQHADLRNKIVHFGMRVGRADAEKSLSVATQFVGHVAKVRETTLR